MIMWIICGFIIFAGTLSTISKRTGVKIEFTSEVLFSMVTFAALGPISIILGTIILNDFNNKR